jgi:beta-glucanase (GH16 family)
MIDLLKIEYEKNGWQWSNYGNGGLAIYEERNVSMPNGELHLKPRYGYYNGWEWNHNYERVYKPMDYASGMVISKRTFLYGHFTFDVTLPNFRGAWPAIWLYPETIGWAQEIDIFEQFRKDSWWTRFRTQVGIYRIQPDRIERLTYARQAYRFTPYDKRRHVFELIWKPESITVKIDGRVRFFVDDPRFAMPSPMNLIMNLAIGDWKPDHTRLSPFIIHKATYEEL